MGSGPLGSVHTEGLSHNMPSSCITMSTQKLMCIQMGPASSGAFHRAKLSFTRQAIIRTLLVAFLISSKIRIIVFLSKSNVSFKPQLHCHDVGPRQSYDSPRFVKSGCIGMILSSAVAPSGCTSVNRSSTVVILEESW